MSAKKGCFFVVFFLEKKVFPAKRYFFFFFSLGINRPMYTSGCYGPSWPASIGWRGQCGTPMTISSDANRILLLFFHVIIITIAVMIIIFIIQLTSFNNARRCQLKTKTLSKYVTIGQIKTGTQPFAHNTPSLFLLEFLSFLFDAVLFELTTFTHHESNGQANLLHH